MEKNKALNLFIILSNLMVIIFNIYAFIFQNESGDIIPFSGLEYSLHYSIFAIIWPIIASIIFVILFPYIGIPIFLKIKKIIWKDYENAYLDISPENFTFSKFLHRSIFIFLLAIGLQITLIPILGYDNFIGETVRQSLVDEKIPAQYAMDVLAGTTALLIPLCVGIWAIGWTLEDSGLIHFSLPKTKDFFEIEPIHIKFNSYIGGFAGFSAIIFYTGAFFYYFFEVNRSIDLLWTIILIFEVIFLSGPSYIIYNRRSKKYLRKDLNEIKNISKEDITI